MMNIVKKIQGEIQMKKWIIAIALAGVLVAGSVVFASDSGTNSEASNPITMDQAKEIALAEVDGSITSAELEDNKSYYDIEIENGSIEYEFEIDAATGEIIDFEKDDKEKHTQQSSDQVMTEEEALAIASEKVSNATVQDIELENNDGQKIYDIELVEGTTKYEFDIDAVTGEIVEYEKDVKKGSKKEGKKETIELTQEDAVENTSSLTIEEAIAIAKEHAPGNVTEVERDDDVFEIEVEDGDIEYELEINIHTGDIVSFDEDRD